MILTLTLNPAVDQTIVLERLRDGEVNRFREQQLDPAGKGINASRMVHRLGWPTIAFGFLAGEVGHLVERALESEGVQSHFVRVPGQTRINTTVVERASVRTTCFYGPGPLVGREHLTTLWEMLRFWLQAGRVLVLAGSLPPGAPDDTYAAYVRLAHAAGVKVILDAAGEALRLGAEAGPDLIKPNASEAAELLGRPLTDEAAVLEGARDLAARGIPHVVISRGAEGAVCVSDDGNAWRVEPPEVELRSTIGSGDSLVAGLAVALARGDPIPAGLRLGAAAGAATAATPGTRLGDEAQVRDLLPRVRVESLDGAISSGPARPSPRPDGAPWKDDRPS
ncbi:MAG TPA: 1-phosphofructokinase [Longimicrobiaceae bacterium]|nr:1-phosphofructokinase [Longimicrobiaceae bacterium]